MATGMNVDCRYQSRQEEKYTFLIKNYVQSFEDKEVLAVVQKPPYTYNFYGSSTDSESIS